MKIVNLLILLCITTSLLSSCNESKNLDRDKAAEIIRKDYNFPEVYREEFWYGAHDYNDSDYTGLQKLEEKGLITIESYKFWTGAIYHRASITDLMSKYMIKNDRGTVLGFVSHTINLREVTGVSLNEEKNKAEVEYIEYVDRVTPIGAFKLRKSLDKLKEGIKKKVSLTLFDDGWRVSSEKKSDWNRLSEGYENYKHLFEEGLKSEVNKKESNNDYLANEQPNNESEQGQDVNRTETTKNGSNTGLFKTIIANKTYFYDGLV
jgi:hypothetical protein